MTDLLARLLEANEEEARALLSEATPDEVAAAQAALDRREAAKVIKFPGGLS